MESCKGKLAGFVALIFVSGMAVGAVATKLADRYAHPPHALTLSEDEMATAVQHLHQELELNEEQARAVEAILDEFIMQQADLMSQFRTSRLSGHDRLLQILNEDQRQRFQKVLSELEQQRKD
jgi:t-SNARE complex subunit (syntaxin)